MYRSLLPNLYWDTGEHVNLAPGSLKSFILNMKKIHFKDFKKNQEKYVYLDNDIYFMYAKYPNTFYSILHKK
jgi:hypothetical protein